jgi:uracil-DNA glycosylase
MAARNSNDVRQTLKDAREYLTYLSELGVEHVDTATSVDISAQTTTIVAEVIGQPPMRRAEYARTETTSTTMQPIAKPAPTSSANAPLPQTSLFGELEVAVPRLAQSGETLEDIWRDIGECTRCGLCEARTQVVNTHGNRNARLMFIGEAPGADEDAQGKPFVGRAGQLLTKIIEAIGMKRDDVIIGNVNRCRPPGNRQPTLEEAAICRPFLFREIAAVQPEVIVVMGNTALRNLLEVREGITRVRGQFQDFRGIKVMPTFHPAYLLRDPSKKRETWEDMKKVKEYLDNQPPKNPAS